MSDSANSPRGRYLRFDTAWTTPIRVGAKTLTIRYDFHRDLDVGDRVELVDDAGTVFALAEIDLAMTMTAREFVRLNPDGHVEYDDVDDLATRLREYYAEPPEGFGPSTELDIFGFEVVERA